MNLERGWREWIQHEERAPCIPLHPAVVLLAVVSAVPSEQWQEQLFPEEDVALERVWELLLRLSAPEGFTCKMPDVIKSHVCCA